MAAAIIPIRNTMMRNVPAAPRVPITAPVIPGKELALVVSDKVSSGISVLVACVPVVSSSSALAVVLVVCVNSSIVLQSLGHVFTLSPLSHFPLPHK